VRVYVPAQVADVRLLETEGHLPVDDRSVALAVTSWALAELGLDDPEDEMAEYAVLVAAAEQAVGGVPPAAVLVFDLPIVEVPSDGLRVHLERELPRRRLAAIHLAPGLEWYAGQELPDVLASLT
jgi:hypothetical protein